MICFGFVKAQSVSGIKHVIVVGVDGLSPDGIRTAPTPHIHQLIAEGAVKWNVRTVLPSSSSPNWASMIMGAGVEAHGITDNDWGRQDYTLPPIVANNAGQFPTIFEIVHMAHPKANIGAVYQWNDFGRLFEPDAVNFNKPMPDEYSTTSIFCNYIKTQKPLLGFMHLDHVDHAGHEYGHGSQEYYLAVTKADSLIGSVVNAIKAAGIEKNTLLIITADHGGSGYGHGGATIEEAEITMVLHGDAIKKAYSIQQQVYTYDLAATIAFALQLTAPYAWTGRPIKSAFKGFNEPANLYSGKTTITSPRIYPWKKLYAQAGGLYVDSAASVSINTFAADAVTRFTTDGTIPDRQSKLYLNPFTLDTTTVITAKSFDKAGNASQPVVAYFRIVHNQQPGVKVKFYKGYDWNHLPSFSALSTFKTWYDYEFGLNRSDILAMLGKDSSSFGLILESAIDVKTAGNYTFYISSDDGSRLLVDGKQLIDNDGDHGVIEKNGTVNLSTGKHSITIQYYNGQGGFWLDAWYKGPGIPKQLIPANVLQRFN